MYRTLVLLLSLAALGIFQSVAAQDKESFDGFKLVDKTGSIRKPDNYRDLYQMLGSWTILDPKGNQMHYTYASPGSAAYYRRNKKFADGTVLVKEILDTDHGQMTTGDAHWATDTKVWFVLIKDAKGRFPNNPLWGDGWGWALFKADAPDKQVATDYKKDCLAATFLQKRTIGFTLRVIRLSVQSENGKVSTWTRLRGGSYGRVQDAKETPSSNDKWDGRHRCQRRSVPHYTPCRTDARIRGDVYS